MISENLKNKIPIAVVKNNDYEGCLELLSKALAPIGYYMTPLIQNIHYLNHVEDDQIPIEEVLQRIEDTPSLQGKIAFRNRLQKIRIYVDTELFRNSNYSKENFLKYVYKQNLPIQFV